MAFTWRPIQIAAVALMIAAYCTMVLGGFVKAIHAGMACPEWPTCQAGNPLPPLSNAGVTAEIFHRIAATAVVASGLALLFFEFRQHPDEKRLLLYTFITAGLVGVQILLGALTISTNLQPFVVTAHLSVATLIFGFTVVIVQRAWKLPRLEGAAPASAAHSPVAAESR